MRRLGLALSLLLLGLAPAQPQSTSWPPPGGAVASLCAYNLVLPTMTSGSVGFIQCDVNGQLLTSGGGGGGGDVNITQVGGVNVPTAGADAQSNTLSAVPTYSRMILYNGTTWDRARSAQAIGDGNAGLGTFSTLGGLYNGASLDRERSIVGAIAAGTGTAAVHAAPTSTAGAATTPVVTGAAADSLVLKASAGNAYSVAATNLTATAGFLVLLNATAAPADGAITPLACAPLPASGSASISYGEIPARFSTGITAVISSAATCFTKTTGVVTAFISGQAQ